ncbi:hypothetical protein Tco_1336257 [Tanacetum coccineum]
MEYGYRMLIIFFGRIVSAGENKEVGKRCKRNTIVHLLFLLMELVAVQRENKVRNLVDFRLYLKIHMLIFFIMMMQGKFGGQIMARFGWNEESKEDEERTMLNTAVCRILCEELLAASSLCFHGTACSGSKRLIFLDQQRIVSSVFSGLLVRSINVNGNVSALFCLRRKGTKDESKSAAAYLTEGRHEQKPLLSVDFHGGIWSEIMLQKENKTDEVAKYHGMMVGLLADNSGVIFLNAVGCYDGISLRLQNCPMVVILN